MRTQTAARTQQLQEQQMLRDMQRALGLGVPDKETERRERARKVDRSDTSPGLHIVLSVQIGFGGLTRYYCYQSKTFIREIAIMDAKREARESGYKTLCVLDIADYLKDVPAHYIEKKINTPKQ